MHTNDFQLNGVSNVHPWAQARRDQRRLFAVPTFLGLLGGFVTTCLLVRHVAVVIVVRWHWSGRLIAKNVLVLCVGQQRRQLVRRQAALNKFKRLPDKGFVFRARIAERCHNPLLALAR